MIERQKDRTITHTHTCYQLSLHSSFVRAGRCLSLVEMSQRVNRVFVL